MEEPLEDNFVGASLNVGGQNEAFLAGQYSFFGDMGEDDALGGALEDGLDAPPEEEGLLLGEEDLGEDEDFSYASMFAALPTDADVDVDDLLEPKIAFPSEPPPLPTSSLFADLSSPMPSSSSTSSAWGASKTGGSIALGSLLMATPPPASAPSSTLTPSSATSASPYGQLPMQMQPQQPQQQQQQQGSGGGMSAQDLEAMLLGKSPGPGAQQAISPFPTQQQYNNQQHMGQLPPGMHPQHAQQYPLPHQAGGGGGPPPGYAPPPPGFPHGPPPPHMHQHQHPQGGMMPRPGPGMYPSQGGMMPPQFPGGMMPPPASRPAWQQGPPPGHIQQQQGPPPYQQQPVALGAGMPRPPPRGYHQPGIGHPSGVAPTMHPHPHANLAQRLRALNLADRHEQERKPLMRRNFNSKYMHHEEIEHLLYMQSRQLHQAPPYMEDYYYQAFVFKYFNKRNKRVFAPESVRELAPTEKMAAGDVAFVKLEGLGKVPFSNIRRPRPLMDLAAHDAPAATPGSPSSTDKAAGEGVGENGEAVVKARPLEQEPLLAARIMIEDCMALILDVQDIDCIFTAAPVGAVENEDALAQRRSLLVDGLAASLRLSEKPALSSSKSSGDGVFLRLLTVPKGRNLAARALRALQPTPEVQKRLGDKYEPNLRVLWAVLRNARALFGSNPAAKPHSTKTSVAEELAVTAKVAAAAAELARHLADAKAVCEAVEATVCGDLATGDGKMPLFAPGSVASDIRYPWLSDLLIAILQRATDLHLVPGSENSVTENIPTDWTSQLTALKGLVVQHLMSLSESADAKNLAPRALMKAIQPFFSKEEQEELKALSDSVGV